LNEDNSEQTRVLIVAGYASVRAGLMALLADAPGIIALGAAEDVNDGLARLIADLRPDALLFDASGDNTDATSLTQLLPLLANDGPPLIVLSDRPERDRERLANADLPGWACLRRDADAPQIIGGVRAAAAGLVALDRALALPPPPPASSIRRPNADEFPGETLTPREIEVMELMSLGLPNKVIATRLKISLHTAKFHVAQILAKLNAESRTEAVTIGARRGYVTL
jgi:DNA-binding NarL/FixJ family response regulator